MKKYSTLIFILISLVIAAILQPEGVQFASFEVTSAFKVLTILFLIALFQERALDVFLTIVRAPESDEKQRKLLHLQRGKDSSKIEKAEQALSNYKIKTRNMAMYLGYVLGFIISMIGIRALEPLVDSGTFQNLGEVQQNMFRMVDIFITGGLMAGGSDGIHKITEILRDFRLKAQDVSS